MMSWSYQSSNPCTVLVKEKQDRDSQHSNQVDCSPSIQSSTNRPIESSSHHQQDHQQDSGSLGNSIGGKKSRIKREVRENFYNTGHGHGHVNADETIEEIIETIERRILVNITVGMDKGLGTTQQEVYHLQVAVPLKAQQKTEDREFYAYNVHPNDESFDKTTKSWHKATVNENNNANGSTEDDITVSDASTTESTITDMDFDYSTIPESLCDCSDRNNSRFYDNRGLDADLFFVLLCY